MAKKITNPEDGAQPAEEQVVAPESQETEQSQPEAPKTTEEPKAAPAVTEIPDHADRILRTFSGYPELYIDSHGGTYTVDSPLVFHSNATLYKNPYHKS